MNYTIYGDIHSGNCYKVKLLMSWLDIGHIWQHVDILQGESRTADFLALNPNGRIPVLELADGRTLAESNAILNYLAARSNFLPADAFECAQVFQWQFFEQYSHEPYIATARYIVRYLGNPETRRPELESRREGGYAALNVMEHHLRERSFFVGDTYTIADISLYAYTHCASEGGFHLDDFRQISAWLARIESHPKHVTMAQFDT